MQQSPKEEKAFQYKVICQIKLGRFDDALTQIFKNSKLAG